MSWTRKIESYAAQGASYQRGPNPMKVIIDEAAEFAAAPARAEAAAKISRLRVQVSADKQHLRSLTKNLDLSIRRGNTRQEADYRKQLVRVRASLADTKNYLDEALGHYYALGGRAMLVLMGWTP